MPCPSHAPHVPERVSCRCDLAVFSARSARASAARVLATWPVAACTSCPPAMSHQNVVQKSRTVSPSTRSSSSGRSSVLGLGVAPSEISTAWISEISCMKISSSLRAWRPVLQRPAWPSSSAHPNVPHRPSSLGDDDAGADTYAGTGALASSLAATAARSAAARPAVTRSTASLS
eukprot:scaffold100613_cov63-Phaeocystis_antarctica.AAC.5